MRVLDGMEIEANKEKVLTTLRTNKERHGKIVAEARTGYLKDAEVRLQECLERVRKGETDNVVFLERAPEDYSNVYTAAITSLEFSIQETVKLNASQVQTLLLDQWDWTRSFLVDNSKYSSTATSLSRGRH